ncbi:hypothetical protein BDA96_02G287300 [Sorghum bicolor]|uniref:Uncharacterized protein n=1 Tax=Sorghum bicolor TaxID=4558 RepID=A0A921UUK6_SORBI|nr:hypothetical protein BDA96_02G287300 [Sorghum bicolor]
MLGCIRILLLLLGGNNSEIPMIRLYIYNIDEVDLDLRSSTVSRAMGARYLWLPDLWGPQCVGKCQGGVVGARRGGEGRGYLGTRWRSAMALMKATNYNLRVPLFHFPPTTTPHRPAAATATGLFSIACQPSCSCATWILTPQ